MKEFDVDILSKSGLVTKLKKLFVYISYLNDHHLTENLSNTALESYIDPRWIFGFLYKYNIHPKNIMSSVVYIKLIWAAKFIEDNQNSRFLNFNN